MVAWYEELDNMGQVLVQPEDQRFFVANPKDFNPDRNKAIIEETIKETTEFFKKLNELDEGGRERMDMVGSYGRYRFNQGDKSFESYVGKEAYRKLMGEKILNKVKMMDSVNKLQGNDKFKKSILI